MRAFTLPHATMLIRRALLPKVDERSMAIDHQTLGLAAWGAGSRCEAE